MQVDQRRLTHVVLQKPVHEKQTKEILELLTELGQLEQDKITFRTFFDSFVNLFATSSDFVRRDYWCKSFSQ